MLHSGTLCCHHILCTSPPLPSTKNAKNWNRQRNSNLPAVGSRGQLTVLFARLPADASAAVCACVCVCVLGALGSWAAADGGSSIVVLMPRVVKREHLHNQIIKICIILFFTIRVLLFPFSLFLPFFHSPKNKFQFQLQFLVSRSTRELLFCLLLHNVTVICLPPLAAHLEALFFPSPSSYNRQMVSIFIGEPVCYRCQRKFASFNY